MGYEVVANLKFYFNCFLNIIFYGNTACVICGNETEEMCICNSCFNKVYYCKEPFVVEEDDFKLLCYSACYYSGVMKELILLLKYKSCFKVVKVIVNYLINTISNFDIEFDVITFVPSTKYSLKKRGFNQSELLAKGISEKTGIRVVNLLERVDETKDQIGLGKLERWENIKKSYKIKNNTNLDIIKDKKVLLVDDVITTGATSFYCSKKLIEMDAALVTVITAARGRL